MTDSRSVSIGRGGCDAGDNPAWVDNLIKGVVFLAGKE